MEVEEEEDEAVVVGVVSFLDATGAERGGERAESPAPVLRPPAASTTSSPSSFLVAAAAVEEEEDLKGLGLGILLLSLVGSAVRTEERGGVGGGGTVLGRGEVLLGGGEVGGGSG